VGVLYRKYVLSRRECVKDFGGLVEGAGCKIRSVLNL
jgi:hypothetical protein